MQISLYDCSEIINRVIGTKIIGLKGVMDFERMKTEFIILDNELLENWLSYKRGDKVHLLISQNQ